MTTKEEIISEIQERLDEIEMMTFTAETGEQWAEIAKQEAEVMELKKDFEWLFRA